jgi:N-acylneuraminate cytidylyltransferase
LIALIPARQNSKRFPGKNRATFNGVSLLEITFKAAKESNVIDEIFISTDDELLAESARSLGINAPFLRDKSLSTDTTSSWEVVMDFIDKTSYSGDICLLQLTSPRRHSSDIVELRKIFRRHGSSPALTLATSNMTSSNHPNWHCNCTHEVRETKHCESAVQVVPNGAAYMIDSSSVSMNSFITLNGCHGFVMPPDRSVDIDFKSQLIDAEVKARNDSN